VRAAGASDPLDPGILALPPPGQRESYESCSLHNDTRPSRLDYSTRPYPTLPYPTLPYPTPQLFHLENYNSVASTQPTRLDPGPPDTPSRRAGAPVPLPS
jgi:hypothetical protein